MSALSRKRTFADVRYRPGADIPVPAGLLNSPRLRAAEQFLMRARQAQYGLMQVWLLHTRPRTHALSQYSPVSPMMPVPVAASRDGVAQPPRRRRARISTHFMRTSNNTYADVAAVVREIDFLTATVRSG